MLVVAGFVLNANVDAVSTGSIRMQILEGADM